MNFHKWVHYRIQGPLKVPPSFKTLVSIHGAGNLHGKILQLTLVVFSINIFSQFAQEEIDLSNEYLSMLSSSSYDQSRIDEIESIAISNQQYEYLRI